MIAEEKVLWCPERRIKYRADVIDMGQKPEREVYTGQEQLAPEFSKVLKIKGTRRKIIELLRDKGPMTAKAIGEKLGRRESDISYLLTRHPEFNVDEGTWHLDTEWLDAGMAAGWIVFTDPVPVIFMNYIRENGPSPMSELAKAAGVKDAFYYLVKPPFVRVSPAQKAIYGVTEKGKEAVFAYRGQAARLLEYLNENGPQTRDELIEGLSDVLEKTVRNAVSTLIRSGHIEKIQDEQPQLWGIEGES